jgi:hypothetical protein
MQDYSYGDSSGFTPDSHFNHRLLAGEPNAAQTYKKKCADVQICKCAAERKCSSRDLLADRWQCAAMQMRNSYKMKMCKWRHSFPLHLHICTFAYLHIHSAPFHPHLKSRFSSAHPHICISAHPLRTSHICISAHLIPPFFLICTNAAIFRGDYRLPHGRAVTL